jgi:arylsulfatase A-like enzyme
MQQILIMKTKRISATIFNRLKQFVLLPLVLLAFACKDKITAVDSQFSEKQPMNVVLFLVDDLGWKDVGCYGSSFYETPNIDQLAQEGVRFTNAYAACHVCSPTRASLLTGKYPATLNLTDWLTGRRDFSFQKLKNVTINQHLPYGQNTLPKILKQHGYETAIYGKWHLGEDSLSTQQQGFDVQLPNWNRGWPKEGYHFPYGMDGLETGTEGEYLTDRMTDESLKFIEKNKEKPFFLYLSHFAVHDPIEGRPDLVEKYGAKLKNSKRPIDPPYILEGRPSDKPQTSRTELNQRLQDPAYQGFEVFPDETVKIKQHQDNVEFAAMVESMDESMGRVLQKLKDLDLDDHTLVIFYSDNGGMSAANFWNPERRVPETELDKAFATSNLPLRAGKGWLYEGGIRVPLIIKWPGQGLQAMVSDVPVTSPDFLPTILDILRIEQPSIASDGLSMVPLLKGQDKIERDAIFWHFPHYSNHGMQSPGGAIRSGNYKLLEYYEDGTIQLFNLKDDIGEQHDLATSEPEKAQALLNKLRNWRKSIGAKIMDPNPDYNGL